MRAPLQSQGAGRLLADWQRINVALTRAQHKMVLVGHAATLRTVPLLAGLLDLVEQRGWRVPLGGVQGLSLV